MRLVKVKVKRGCWGTAIKVRGTGKPRGVGARWRRPEELVIQVLIWQLKVLEALHFPELLYPS